MTSRRSLLRAAALAGAPLPLLRARPGRADGERPRIAAVVTEYRPNSHADVIVTKFLEGCRVLDFDFQPRTRIASLYLDQVPPNDIGRELAAKHQVPIHATIEGALTLGTGRLAVDGVLLIGEHGRYPYNEIGQHLYPRRRFFEEAAAVVRRAGRAVPMFNDKHLSAGWADAKWMYDTARELRIPFMAGSSIPVTWRRPELEIPRGTRLDEVLAVGYGGTESYGFHTLEGLQCVAERRRGGESGVLSVQALSGEAVWKAAEEGRWSRELLAAALARSEQESVRAAGAEEIRRRVPEPVAFLVEYRDGCRGTALLLRGLTQEFLVAARARGREKPFSTLFWLQEGRPFGHFARLSHAIERMFLTGRPTYPVERTLLTTGILDRAMHSLFEKGRKLETPELAVRYEPSA